MKSYTELVESVFNSYKIKGETYDVFVHKNPEGSELLSLKEVGKNKLNAIIYNDKHVFIWYEDVSHKVMQKQLNKNVQLPNPKQVKIDVSGNKTKITVLDNTSSDDILDNKYIIKTFKNIEVIYATTK